MSSKDERITDLFTKGSHDRFISVIKTCTILTKTTKKCKVHTSEMNQIRSNVFERYYFNNIAKTKLAYLNDHVVSNEFYSYINHHETVIDHYCSSSEEEDMLSCNYFGILFGHSSSSQEHVRHWSLENSKKGKLEVDTIDEESKLIDKFMTDEE